MIALLLPDLLDDLGEAEKSRVKKCFMVTPLLSLETGKRKEEIFQMFYALLYRTYDHSSENALPASVKQGVHTPRTYKEAVKSKHAKEWDVAIREEIQTLIQNGIWEEFVLLEGANLVSAKWVFDIKETMGNKIERFKARLVAMGFT